MKPFKLFQYDKKVWEDGDTNRTFQIGIIKNHTLLHIIFETPSGILHPCGGFRILFSFLASSLFGVDFQSNKMSLSFYFFTEYFPGWD